MEEDLKTLEEQINARKNELEETANIVVEQEQSLPIAQTESEKSGFELQTTDNEFVKAMTDNSVAVGMAKSEYEKLKNQKKIADKIGQVANENTKTEIESARLKVKEKDKNNKIKKQEINNELLRLKNERTLLIKEQKHAIEMQRARHIKETYYDLLLRTCRKKQKDDNGKLQYISDKDGNPIINIPSRLRLCLLRFFDGLISTLNQTAEIFSALNKNVVKAGFIILILLLIFIPPFRVWLLSLIGISL